MNFIWDVKDLKDNATYLYFPINVGKTLELEERYYLGQPRMAEGWYCSRLRNKCYAFLEFKQPNQEDFVTG